MVNRYLSEPLIDYKSGDPLRWWNENKCQFSYLLALAQRLLSAPTTSVPSGLLFSGAGILYDEQRNRFLYDEQRNRLSAEHAEMLLYIKCNMNCSVL